ncbi:hypothetical protein BDL97_03G077400 [Sphagnum fallax]|nr:hypothetical protein BDL97_03G077400 [Sphagnum fallax]
MQTYTAPPKPQIDELVAAERSKDMPQGGDEIKESNGNDPFMDSGDNAGLQLEGLLEDLEIDVQSPTMLDPQCVISQEKLGGGFATDDDVTAIKTGMLGMVGRENGHDSFTDEDETKSAMLEVKPVQDFALSIAEEAAVAPNLLSGLPVVKTPVLPAEFSSEAAFPSSMAPTDCLQQTQMSSPSLVSRLLLHEQPGQEQSPVMTKFLKSPRDGVPKENTDANQPSSSMTANAILSSNAICTDCTIPPETLNYENSASNTSIVEVSHQNLMSAGRVTEVVDHSDGPLSSTDTVPAAKLQGESGELGFLPTSDTLVNKESLRKCAQPESEVGLESGTSKETQQNSYPAETSAIMVERPKIMPEIVPTSGLQYFDPAPCTTSPVSQPITLESPDAVASVMPHVASCASPMYAPANTDLRLEGMMPATQNPDFVEANFMKKKTACTQEPQDLMASATQDVTSEHQTSLPVIPLADHLQPEDSGHGTVRCAPGPSLYEFATAPQSLQLQMQMETDKQLQQVQNSAQDAMVAATSVLEQSQSVWARIQSQYPSELGAVWDAQIASVAATIAAAASITKAAVEAAKAITQASNEAFNHLGLRIEEGSAGTEAVPLHLTFCNSNRRDEGRNAQMESHMMMTAAATSAGEMKKRAIAAARDAMVRAAKATSQAGDVITTGIHLLQAKAVEDAWNTKLRDQDGHSSKLQRVGRANRKGKEERKLTADRPTRSVVIKLNPANRKGKRRERKVSVEKPTTIKLSPSNRNRKVSKVSAEKPRRIVAVEHRPANRKHEESKMSAGKAKRSMAVEHNPAHRKHKESQLGAQKNTISMAVEFCKANTKGKKEKSKVSADNTATSMATELIPANPKGKKEKRKFSGKKPINMAMELTHSNRKDRKEKQKVSAEKPLVSMAMELSCANREGKEEKSKASGEKPMRSVAVELSPANKRKEEKSKASGQKPMRSVAVELSPTSRKHKEEKSNSSGEKPMRSLAVELSPANRKRRADSKATAEKPAKKMAMELDPANTNSKVEGNVSAQKPTKRMATEHSPVNTEHKMKSKVSAKKPTESMTAELSTANRKRKAESNVTLEKNLVAELIPVKRKGKEKVSAEEPAHIAIKVTTPNRQHKEKSQAKSKVTVEKASKTLVAELSPVKRKGNEKVSAEEPAHIAIEVTTANRPHKEKSEARATRSMAKERSPAFRKHEENQVRGTRSMTTELNAANRTRMEESPISLEKSTRSTVVDLSPTNRKRKREDSKVNTERPTRSMDVKLSPATTRSKERKLSEGIPSKSKAEGLSPIDMRGEVASPANMKENKKESKVSDKTSTSSFGVELRPAKMKGKKENKVIEETPTRSLAVELSPANLKHKNGSKVSEEMPTSVAVELSLANTKGKNKKSKVSKEMFTRSKAVEFSLVSRKGKKYIEASTEKPINCVEVDNSLTPERSASRITRQSIQEAKTKEDVAVNQNTATSMGDLLLKSSSSSGRISTRNIIDEDVRILASSVHSSSLKAKTSKNSKAVRVNTLMTRMQHTAELNQPEQSLKLPSTRHSSKGDKKSSAKTVSTRSEARQLRSKTSQTKIYNILKKSTH